MPKTLQYGIDLGTTNSAIAQVSAKGAEVIPVRRLNYIPSVVAVDRRGDLKVGVEAINPLFDSARSFKRLMGTSNTVPLGDGSSWTPERLSAEVLKCLRAAAKLKTNEDIDEVVITVPAMFTQPQCEATNEAARAAGMRAAVLLQEPIAAATAYLSDNASDGYYLIYDLGGGTFDVSLLRLRAGELNVIEHGGDNYLGGADFDRAVFDWALDQIDRKAGDCSQFGEGARRHQLMTMCEDARVALSDQELANIYLDDFDLPVARIELSRTLMHDLIESFVTRSIEITRERLRTPAGAAPRAILLVGGPTQTPYIRQRLAEELQIPISVDQDPMTVVARGAALHAGSILSRKEKAPARVSGVAQFDLFYEPVAPEQKTTIAGKAIDPVDLRGEVRISLTSGDWETGWINLVGGAFQAEISLGRTQVSEYKIELRDLQGRSLQCIPDAFSVRSGVRVAQPVTPYDYGVVLEGGDKVAVIVEHGQPLPATGSREFRLNTTLVAGSPHSVPFYFVEGSSSHADENTQVGSLEIKGTDIKRTLKENEAVEIRVRMDESRRLKANVYVPTLDIEFPVELQSITEAPNCEDLANSFKEARAAIVEIDPIASSEDQDLLIRVDRRLEQLEATFQRVLDGEIGEAERCHKQLSDAKASLRPLREKYGVIARHREVTKLIDEAGQLCTRFNDQMGLAKLKDLRSDAEKALRLENEKAMESVRERARDLFWEHYGKTRECWEYQVQLMRDRGSIANDTLTYFELVRRAEAALADNDFEGVAIAYWRSWELLPRNERTARRFEDAALRPGHV